MKIITIVGARPQFIKLSALSRVMKEYNEIDEIIIHTGQHYDNNMSENFFKELNINIPKYNLEVGSGNHGKQTGLMMERIEKILIEEQPTWVVVFGDTNSTIAGALAAAKLNIKVAHIEAGLRSFNRNMPEEINRIVTDHISTILFAPTMNAMDILKDEGLADKAIFSGDIMYDSVKYYENLLDNTLIESDSQYYLATIHRQENTNNLKRINNIFTAFSIINERIILPLHPRTKKYIKDIEISDNVEVINPVSYLKLLTLIKKSRGVLTDSGGIQKEAFFLKKPCITLRDETEWIETLEDGWNYVVGDNITTILNKIKKAPPTKQKNYFGDGHSAKKICNVLLNNT